MNEQSQFIERLTQNARHRQTLADNAWLQARNTQLEKELKELKTLSVWQFIKSKFKKSKNNP